MLTRSFIVIPRHSRDGLRVKVKNVLKGGKETEYARPELCSELKQAISEQRRIDASHAEARGSIPLAQHNLASVFPGNIGEVGKVGREADVRLVLPLEPWKDKSKKGEKKKIERSFLKGSKNMFTDKGTQKPPCWCSRQYGRMLLRWPDLSGTWLVNSNNCERISV